MLSSATVHSTAVHTADTVGLLDLVLTQLTLTSAVDQQPASQARASVGAMSPAVHPIQRCLLYLTGDYIKKNT
jgi:hypothetical protein